MPRYDVLQPNGERNGEWLAFGPERDMIAFDMGKVMEYQRGHEIVEVHTVRLTRAQAFTLLEELTDMLLP